MACNKKEWAKFVYEKYTWIPNGDMGQKNSIYTKKNDLNLVERSMETI